MSSLASQSSVCWAVLQDVFMGLRSISGIAEHCMLGSVVGCVQGFGSMSGIAEDCMLGSVVGCVQEFGVRV